MGTINPSNVYISDDSKFIDKRRSNVKSDLIEITEDKLENILLKHLQYLGIKQAWLTPASISVTVLVTLLTASFKSSFGLDASVWQAIFCLIAFGSLAWLVVSIVRTAIHWKKASLKNLIAVIKNAEGLSEETNSMIEHGHRRAKDEILT